MAEFRPDVQNSHVVEQMLVKKHGMTAMNRDSERPESTLGSQESVQPAVHQMDNRTALHPALAPYHGVTRNLEEGGVSFHEAEDDEDEFTTYGETATIAYAKANRMTSAVRIDVTSELASLADRPKDYGRKVESRPSGGLAPPPQGGYKPYRKAERVLGVRITPSRLSEDGVSLDVGGQSNGPKPPTASLKQISGPGTLSPILQELSPRSMRLPLTSNPVEMQEAVGARTPPSTTKSKRISYELPPVSTNGPYNFSRQTITRTPHPVPNQFTLDTAPTSTRPKECGLILCVYGHNNSVPRYKRLIVPAHGDLHEQEPKTPELDDERLFEMMRKEHRNLCGSVRRLLSLHTVKCLKPTFWSPNSGKPYEDWSTRTPGFKRPVLPPWPEFQMWRRFQKPRLGRQQYQWVEWVRQMSSYSTDGSEEAAVEFVEGWSVWRILLIGSVMGLLSIAVGVLWIILGVDLEGHRGWKGAETRMNTGVLLSGVVMMMSWSLFGAWALLSWLTM